jgi:hypothetical protein
MPGRGEELVGTFERAVGGAANQRLVAHDVPAVEVDDRLVDDPQAARRDDARNHCGVLSVCCDGEGRAPLAWDDVTVEPASTRAASGGRRRSAPVAYRPHPERCLRRHLERDSP